MNDKERILRLKQLAELRHYYTFHSPIIAEQGSDGMYFFHHEKYSDKQLSAVAALLKTNLVLFENPHIARSSEIKHK